MSERPSVYLSDTELAELITMSCRERFLSVQFGGALEDVPSNRWAFKHIANKRKQRKQ